MSDAYFIFLVLSAVAASCQSCGFSRKLWVAPRICTSVAPAIASGGSGLLRLRGGQRHTGTCKWFSATKGHGFITPDQPGGEDIFVHQTSIHAEGFRSLAEGEPVISPALRLTLPRNICARWSTT